MKIALPTVSAVPEMEIAEPCPASWGAMQGAGKVRFCGECRKHVHDVSQMTAAEASQLTGAACVQLYRRPDGTLLTGDGPATVRERIWRLLRRRLALAAALFALVFLPGCPAGGNLRRPDHERAYVDVNKTPAPQTEEMNVPALAAPDAR